MTKKRTELAEIRKDEKKQLILKNATKTFSEKGYHATSVKDITDAANISVGTFYLYFQNKEDVFEKLYECMADNLEKAENYATNEKSVTVAEKFTRAISATLWTYQKFSQLTRIMQIEAVGLNPRFEQKRLEFFERRRKSVEAIFIHICEKGVIKIEDTYIASIAYMGTFQVVYNWLLDDQKGKLTDCAYPLAIYNLQALKISFEHEKLKIYIAEILLELEKLDQKLNKFEVEI